MNLATNARMKKGQLNPLALNLKAIFFFSEVLISAFVAEPDALATNTLMKKFRLEPVRLSY